MDWPGWKAALELWLKTPELIAGTILLLLAVGGLTARLAWKYRDHTATGFGELFGLLRVQQETVVREPALMTGLGHHSVDAIAQRNFEGLQGNVEALRNPGVERVEFDRTRPVLVCPRDVARETLKGQRTFQIGIGNFACH
jgi:hypothetical protein